jgi:ATP-dependent protease ClpP protease subunit
MRKANPSGHVYLIGDVEDEQDFEKNVAVRAITSMLEAHKKLRPGLPITLFISTYGGDVNIAWAVCATIDRIRREGRKVIGHVMGFAYSAGFFILQHCDVRISEATSTFMVHEMQHDVDGSSTSIARRIAHDKKLEKYQFEMWTRRTGKPLSYYIEKNAGHDWFMLPHEALDEKFIDTILPGPKFPKLIKPVKPAEPI